MKAREKKQCQLRFYPDEFKRIQKKAAEEGVNYQHLGEVLFNAFLKNDKHIMKLVRKYVDSKNANSKILDEFEKDELFRMLEEKSPLAELEK